MKQSTKLLSLVLALIMAFSCMSVIGNAITTFTSPSNIAYDNIDDALPNLFCGICKPDTLRSLWLWSG